MNRLILIVLLFPVSLSAGWIGENYLGATWNPAGLVNETVLARRISFADTNSFLLSDAHLDLVAFVSIFPVGSLAAGRVKVSPLLFLDIGFAAGIHACWDFYSFPDGTTDYGENVRESMQSGKKIIPYISPFWVIKLKFGPLILYNSFYLEKFFHDKLWYYWYPELMVRDGWVLYWNSYTLYEVNPKFYLMVKGHLQKSYDTGDVRFHIGPGVRFNALGRNNFFVVSLEYHVREVNFSGIKLNAGMETTFSW